MKILITHLLYNSSASYLRVLSLTQHLLLRSWRRSRFQMIFALGSQDMCHASIQHRSKTSVGAVTPYFKDDAWGDNHSDPSAKKPPAPADNTSVCHIPVTTKKEQIQIVITQLKRLHVCIYEYIIKTAVCKYFIETLFHINYYLQRGEPVRAQLDNLKRLEPAQTPRAWRCC